MGEIRVGVGISAAVLELLLDTLHRKAIVGEGDIDMDGSETEATRTAEMAEELRRISRELRGIMLALARRVDSAVR